MESADRRSSSTRSSVGQVERYNLSDVCFVVPSVVGEKSRRREIRRRTLAYSVRREPVERSNKDESFSSVMFRRPSDIFFWDFPLLPSDFSSVLLDDSLLGEDHWFPSTVMFQSTHVTPGTNISSVRRFSISFVCSNLQWSKRTEFERRRARFLARR